MTMTVVCTIGNAQAFNLIWIETFNPEKILKVETVKAVVDVEIYPDQSGDIINVKNASPINEIRVYNAKGTLVSKKSHLSKDFDYDISKLDPGEYCFRIQIDKDVVTKMVTKS